MLSKSELKGLRSLHQKKYRNKERCFLAEGDKSVREALRAGARVEAIFHTPQWELPSDTELSDVRTVEVTERELNQICELQHPNGAVAVVGASEDTSVIPLNLKDRWTLYLEGVRDPGNLGTILRIADWYGMERVLVSPDCVDPFNQKVIQASMGAIFRIACITMPWEELVENAAQQGVALAVSTLEGQNIHSTPAPSQGIMVMGNESKGVTPKAQSRAQDAYHIPGAGKAESLNVGVATGILVDWMMRSQ